MAFFSPKFLELMNLYDVESKLSYSARLNMYTEIVEILYDNRAFEIDHPFNNMFKDVFISLTKFHNDLTNHSHNQHNHQIYSSAIVDLFFKCALQVLPDNSLGAEMKVIHKNFKHLYNDSQNVHEFVSSAISLAKKIINQYPANYSRLFDHVFFDNIENIKINGVNGTDLFASIYFFITNHKHKNELLKRLFEEINECTGTCSLGHITRMINSIQGFDEDFCVILNDYELEKAKIFEKLNKELDVFDLFSKRDFEILINSGKIDFPNNPQMILRILKDYSKIDWFLKKSNDKIIFYTA